MHTRSNHYVVLWVLGDHVLAFDPAAATTMLIEEDGLGRFWTGYWLLVEHTPLGLRPG
jgi:hypothetical protein